MYFVSPNDPVDTDITKLSEVSLGVGQLRTPKAIIRNDGYISHEMLIRKLTVLPQLVQFFLAAKCRLTYALTVILSHVNTI